MGIRDLFVFLRNQGILYEKHSISYFSQSIIAVDGYSLFFRLYYAAKKMGMKKHKENSIALLDTFLRKWPASTVLIFVLDNPVKSELKRDTIMKRRADDQAVQKEIKALELAAESEDGEMNPIMRARREMLQQRSKETFPYVCRDMIDHLRTHDYKVLVSDGEAERTACEMVIAEEANYVYSNDSDCLALSCPAIIVDDSGGFMYVLRLQSILDKLELDAEEFTDFCILLGTDFNDRVQGPFEALRNIKEFKRFENIPGIEDKIIHQLEKVRLQYHSPEDDSIESPEEVPPIRKQRKPKKVVF